MLPPLSKAIEAVQEEGSERSRLAAFAVKVTLGVVLLSYILVCTPVGPRAAISASMVVI